MAVDPFIVVGIAIMAFLALLANTYLIINLLNPKDKNNSYFSRFIILFSFELSWLSVLFLPVDSANNAGDPDCDEWAVSGAVYCGGVDTYMVWKSLFMAICFIYVFIIPLVTAISNFVPQTELVRPAVDLLSDVKYEKPPNVCFEATKTLLLNIILGILLSGGCVALYFYYAATNIPVSEHVISLNDMELINVSSYNIPYPLIHLHNITIRDIDNHSIEDNHIIYDVDFPIYVMGFMGWLGWWIFSIFVGVGIAALPFDLICAYIYRPIVLPPAEIAEKEIALKKNLLELQDIAKMLKQERKEFTTVANSTKLKQQRALSDRLEMNRLTQCVYFIEQEAEELRGYKEIHHNYNPILPYVHLAVGLLITLVSAAWICQLVLYIIVYPSVTDFLNTYFIWFDSWFPMFGVISYAIFAMYLLACVVKGCFKMCLYIPFVKLRPVSFGGTYLDSLLFNTSVILFCTIPLVHLCTEAFNIYTLYSDVYFIFQVEVYYLTFYSIFLQYNVFPCIIVFTAIVSTLHLIRTPRAKPPSFKELKQNLQRRSADYISTLSELKVIRDENKLKMKMEMSNSKSKLGVSLGLSWFGFGKPAQELPVEEEEEKEDEESEEEGEESGDKKEVQVAPIPKKSVISWFSFGNKKKNAHVRPPEMEFMSFDANDLTIGNEDESL